MKYDIQQINRKLPYDIMVHEIRYCIHSLCLRCSTTTCQICNGPEITSIPSGIPARQRFKIIMCLFVLVSSMVVKLQISPYRARGNAQADCASLAACRLSQAAGQRLCDISASSAIRACCWFEDVSDTIRGITRQLDSLDCQHCCEYNYLHPCRIPLAFI